MRPPRDAAATAPSRGAWPGLSAEDRFAQVIEALPIALILTGATGRIEMANREAERVFGYDHAELRGEPLDALIPERFRRRIDLGELFLTNRPSPTMGAGWDLSGLRKDRSEFPLEIELSPIDLDRTPMLLAAITDITTRRALEREKLEKQAELERSNADLEEFAYAASHDLKAPLRAIGHLAQWIGEDVRTTAGPETMANLTLLRGRVTRLQMLLDGLLAYARVGQRSHASSEDVDIAEVVRDIVTMLAPPPGFVVACDGNPPRLRAHRAPLQVVLKNLIGNALKHHDRAEGHVSVTMRLADGVAEFRVADDGPGIAPRFHERVFVIFETLASRDDVESSGIGLAIVRRQVRSNGGDIRIESEPSARGTNFVFTWREVTP